MIFDRLGKKIVRYNKFLIITWIVIAILLASRAAQVNDMLTSDFSNFIPQDMESKRASDILKEEFPDLPVTSLIVVIHTDPSQSGTSSTASATTNSVFDPTIKDFIETLDDEIEKYPHVISVDNYYGMNDTIHQGYYEGTYQGLLEAIKEAHEDFNKTQSFYDLDEDERDEMFRGLAAYFADEFNMDADEIENFIYDIYNLKFNFHHVDGEDIQALANNYTDRWDLERHHFLSNYTNYYDFLYTNHSMFNFNQNPIRVDTVNGTGYGFYNGTQELLDSITSDTIYHDPVLMMTEEDMVFFVYTYYGIFHYLENENLLHPDNTTDQLNQAASVLPPELDPYTNVHAVYQLGLAANGGSGVGPSSQPVLATFTYILADNSNVLAQRELRDQIKFYYELFEKEMNYFDLSSDFVTMLFDALGGDLGDFERDLMEAIYDLGPHVTEDEFSQLAEEKTKEFIKDNPLSESQTEDVLKRFVSNDNDTTIAFINLDTSSSSEETRYVLEQLDEDIARIKAEVLPQQTNETTLSTEITDFEVYVTGEGAFNLESGETSEQDMALTDIVSVILILIILMIIFRSPIAALLPLIAMGISIIIVRGLLYTLGFIGIQIHVMASMFTTPVLLGAGSDYCIFIISRFFEELRSGKDKRRAIRKTLETAGKTVASSGSTVMIGFASMLPTKFGLMRIIGMSVLMGVGIALISALTFIPSILLLLGDRLFWPRRWNSSKGQNSSPRKGPGFIRKVSHIVVKRPKMTLVLILAVSIPLIAQVAFIHLSYDSIATMPPTEAKQGYDILAEELGEGEISPMDVVIRFKNGTSIWNQTILEEVGTIADYLETLNGTDTVMSVKKPYGTQEIKYLKFEKNETARALMDMYISEDNDTTYLSVFLEKEPYSDEAMNLAREIKTYLVSYQANSTVLSEDQCEIFLGGSSQGNVEMDKLLWNDFYGVMLPITFAGIFVVLLILLLSVPTPLRLIATILLSVLQILGLTTLVFQNMLGIPIEFTLPIIVFVVLMGLGMDYDIFLVSRMREIRFEPGKETDDATAIITALERTGTIITSCGCIMAAAFGSMMLSSTTTMKMYGFALATAIILDATIVRLFLVPSIMLLAGKWNWWPPKLAKIIESKLGKIEH
ncbi:MAG: MMPL family transporter [Promethearchaeota archaeon]